MKLTKGSMVHIGPYKMIVLYNKSRDCWNLLSTDPGGSVVALNYISKSPNWDLKALSAAVEDGDILLTSTYGHGSVYDGRHDKGKYKITHKRPGLMAYIANMRWLWRNW